MIGLVVPTLLEQTHNSVQWPRRNGLEGLFRTLVGHGRGPFLRDVLRHPSVWTPGCSCWFERLLRGLPVIEDLLYPKPADEPHPEVPLVGNSEPAAARTGVGDCTPIIAAFLGWIQQSLHIGSRNWITVDDVGELQLVAATAPFAPSSCATLARGDREAGQ